MPTVASAAPARASVRHPAQGGQGPRRSGPRAGADPHCKGSLAGLDDSRVAPRDRALLREICYGVCRALPRLEALAGVLLKKPFKARDTDIQALLLVGIYQLLYLRIPAHAAVGETAGAARLLGKEWATRVLNGCLRRLQREASEMQAKVDRDPAVALLHPVWWLKALRQAWPDDWREIAIANNQPGPMTLRVNRRRSTRKPTWSACARPVSTRGPASTPRMA